MVEPKNCFRVNRILFSAILLLNSNKTSILISSEIPVHLLGIMNVTALELLAVRVLLGVLRSQDIGQTTSQLEPQPQTSHHQQHQHQIQHHQHQSQQRGKTKPLKQTQYPSFQFTMGAGII